MREDRQALLDAGISYLQDGRLPDAIDAFTSVVHLDPDDVHGHFGLGLSCIFAGRLLDATEEFLALKELGADDLAEQLSLERDQAEYPGVFVDGGPGNDFATAFVVRGAPTGSVGIEAEYRHLAGLFGVRVEDWDLEFQSLREHGSARYDLLAIILKDGSRKQVYFDITDFFAKPG